MDTRQAKCVSCGKIIVVNKRTSITRCKCKECNKKRYLERYKKICSICGQKQCIRRDICNKRQLFPALVKYFGFDDTKLGSLKVYEEFERVKNLLIEDYYDKNFSIPIMQEKYKHTNSGNFFKLLRAIGLDLRTLSEGVKIGYKEGRVIPRPNNSYKTYYHTTWNNKQVFLRSSYEYEYAKQLDSQRINYDVEKLRILYWDTIKNRQRIAVPDFYLIDTNTIVEIKSTYTYDKQNMLDRRKSFIEHGYKFRLILEKKEVDLGV